MPETVNANRSHPVLMALNHGATAPKVNDRQVMRRSFSRQWETSKSTYAFGSTGLI